MELRPAANGDNPANRAGQVIITGATAGKLRTIAYALSSHFGRRVTFNEIVELAAEDILSEKYLDELIARYNERHGQQAV